MKRIIFSPLRNFNRTITKQDIYKFVSNILYYNQNTNIKIVAYNNIDLEFIKTALALSEGNNTEIISNIISLTPSFKLMNEFSGELEKYFSRKMKLTEILKYFEGIRTNQLENIQLESGQNICQFNWSSNYLIDDDDFAKLELQLKNPFEIIYKINEILKNVKSNSVSSFFYNGIK